MLEIRSSRLIETVQPAVRLDFMPRGKVFSRRFPKHFQRDLPCPLLAEKIFRFPRRANHRLIPSRLTRTRGGSRSSRNARWDAVDAVARARMVSQGGS
jgi:hypothetical protein